MSKRKILALLLAVVMICSLFVSPALAADNEGIVAISDTVAPKFTDVDGHWAESAIARWAEAGIIEGDGDGTVNPGRSLKRAELAATLSRILGLKESAPANTFSDVAADAWYADAVLKCAKAGIMLGDGTGKANPEAAIDRQQTIVMVGRALGVKPASGNSLNRFEDADAVADWAEPYMVALTSMGILNGLPSGDGFVIAPTVNIDRASTFVLLDKAIAQYITAPCTVTVNDDDKFVVINSAAEEAGVVTVTGKTAGVVVAVGTTDDVVLDRANVGVLKVDAPVDVTINRGSVVTDLDANAATDVTNNGTVANLNTNADDVTFDGNKPAEVNTAEDVEPAKDSKGNEVTAQPTTSGGGSTGGSSSVVRADVVVAPLFDQAGVIDQKDLGTVSVTSRRTALTDGVPTYAVTVTGKNIMNHSNTTPAVGHWVGFGMPAKDEGSYTYKVDGSEVPTIATRTYETNGKTYNTVYFSYDTEEEFNAAERTITVEDAGEVIATYVVSFKVTFKSDYSVSMLAELPEALLAAYDEPNLPIRHKTAAGLGLKAAVSGNTMTLTGETTKAKLEATVSGATNDDGYVLYGLNVGNAYITKVKTGVATYELTDFTVDGLANAYLMNSKIYNGTDKTLLADTVEIELLDAEGRVQGKISQTFDATAVTIEGMKKAVFQDAAGNVIATLMGEDSVTAPAVPASTDEIYYTGNWVAGETTVKAGDSIDLTAAEAVTTFKAENVAITAQTFAFRPNGPEDHGDPAATDFHYAEAYKRAGLALTNEGALSVDGAVLVDYAAKNADELAHLKNKAGTKVVCGVAYHVPTGATHVACISKLTDTVTEKDELVVDNDNGTIHNKQPISYIPVATVDENNVITLVDDATMDADYYVWYKDDTVIAVTKANLTIKTKVPTFTVTYKAEDGTQIEKVEIPYNKADWELRKGIPTKLIPYGYRWDYKWYAEGSDEAYTVGILTGDLTLIAKFALAEYEVDYDWNGGSGYLATGPDPITIEDKNFTTGVIKTLAQVTGFYRPGFEFICWASEDGAHTFKGGQHVSGEVETIDELISLAESYRIRLVAQWKPVATISTLDKTAIETVLTDGWANGLKADNMVITLDTANAVEGKDGVITISAAGELTPYKYAGFGAGVDKNQSFVVLAIEKPAYDTSNDLLHTDHLVTDVVVRAGIDKESAAYALKVADFTDTLGEGEDAKEYAVVVMLVGNEEQTAKSIDIWVDWTGMKDDAVTGTHYVIDLSGVTFKAAETTTAPENPPAAETSAVESNEEVAAPAPAVSAKEDEVMEEPVLD